MKRYLLRMFLWSVVASLWGLSLFIGLTATATGGGCLIADYCKPCKAYVEVISQPKNGPFIDTDLPLTLPAGGAVDWDELCIRPHDENMFECTDVATYSGSSPRAVVYFKDDWSRGTSTKLTDNRYRVRFRNCDSDTPTDILCGRNKIDRSPRKIRPSSPPPRIHSRRRSA